MERRENKGRKATVKGFLAWVNAEEEIDVDVEDLDVDEENRDIDEENLDVDKGLLDADEGHLGHDDENFEDVEEDLDSHEDSDDEREKFISKVDDLSLVDYEGDDEFDYPDEIVVIEELEPDNNQEIDYADSVPAYQDTVHMTKKEKRRMGRFRVFYLLLSAIVAVNVIGILLITVNYLPPFGGVDNPAVNEVYTRYVVQSVEETGALNIVSAVLYSYRSFDTLGEAFVLFTAIIGVIMLLRETKSTVKGQLEDEETDEEGA